MNFDKNVCPVCQKEISRAESFHNNGMCRTCYQRSVSNEDILHKPKGLLDRWHDEHYRYDDYYYDYDE